MIESESLFHGYAAGAIVTLAIGIWLSHNNGIECPIRLTVVVTNEWMLIVLVLFWPILGPAVLAEIVFRGWIRRWNAAKRENHDGIF